MLKVSHKLVGIWDDYEHLPQFIKEVIKKQDIVRYAYPRPGKEVAIYLRPDIYFYSDLVPIFRLGGAKVSSIKADGDMLRFVFNIVE